MDMARMQVQLTNSFTNYSLEPIADKEFRFGGTEITDPNASLKDARFWAEMRTDSLSRS